MSLNSYIKKLRIAADALEDLLESNPFNDVSKAKKIMKGKHPIIKNDFDELNIADPSKFQSKEKFTKQWVKPPQVSNSNETEPIKVNAMKSKTYPKGSHWTQKSENAAKLKRTIRKMHKGRKESGKLNQYSK